jgi:dTMP kinase
MFITLEGPEGAGKSSQMQPLADFLRGEGFTVETTREPGGTEIGDQIRACLHDTANTGMRPVTEVLLYAASRAQLVGEVIRPALSAGKVILSDRYTDSTMAYQGYGRGIALEVLSWLTELATGGLKPDLTILLDIDVAQGLARRQGIGNEMNRIDLETIEFHNRVRDGYRLLAAAEPERWVVVKAGRPLRDVQADLRRIVMARLKLTTGS